MNGVLPTPGTMRLSSAAPNPNGAEESQLFLFSGDATGGPIQKVELAPGVALPASPGLLDTQDFNLRIFHFNDLHGFLMHFTQEGEEAVLPRIHWKIQSARQECQEKPDTAILVVSAGDDCTGSIFDELLMDTGQATPIHPGYQLYSKLGVDLAGLGNHDLDRGLPFLADSIRHNTQFPILAANLKGCTTLSELCHPAALLVVKDIRVGLIGLVTRAETHLDPDVCQIVDPIPVANNLVPAIRPLCDVLIIISHLGHSMKSPVPMADAGDVEVAQSLPYGSVDLIIGGHSHTVLNRDGLCADNIVNGIPIVQTGARGEYLGQVELTIQKENITVTGASLIPTDSLQVDQAFEDNEMQPFIKRARELWGQPLGQVENIPDLSTKAVLNDFAKRELALANFITDALVERLTQRGFRLDFAMIDASTLQCGLPFSDNLTYGDCFEVMPFTDTLRLYQITGRQLQDLFTDNVLRIDRPDDPHIERGFLQFSREVEYTIELGKMRTDGHAKDIRVRKTPLARLATTIFTIATTSFTRKLAAPWEAAWNRTQDTPLLDLYQFPFIETDFLLRQEMVTYIQERGGVTRAGGAQRDGRLRVRI